MSSQSRQHLQWTSMNGQDLNKQMGSSLKFHFKSDLHSYAVHLPQSYFFHITCLYLLFSFLYCDILIFLLNLKFIICKCLSCCLPHTEGNYCQYSFIRPHSAMSNNSSIYIWNIRATVQKSQIHSFIHPTNNDDHNLLGTVLALEVYRDKGPPSRIHIWGRKTTSIPCDGSKRTNNCLQTQLKNSP